jgi:hypothetical protein
VVNGVGKNKNLEDEMKRIISIVMILSMIFCVPTFAQDKTAEIRLDELEIE